MNAIPVTVIAAPVNEMIYGRPRSLADVVAWLEELATIKVEPESTPLACLTISDIKIILQHLHASLQIIDLEDRVNRLWELHWNSPHFHRLD